MKLWKRLIILFVIAGASTAWVLAHPGRTDGSGGHTNHSTGQYHYHHGYPEHYHTNGICPYEYDDKTEESSGASDHSTPNKPIGGMSNQEPQTSMQNEDIPESLAETADQPSIYFNFIGWLFLISLIIPFIVSFSLGAKYKVGIYNKEIEYRNKMFFTISIVVSVVLLFLLYLAQAKFTGEFRFVRITNRNTGEPASVLSSLVIYAFLGGIFSILVASMFAFYTLLLYMVLHRNDGGLSRFSLHEQESHYAAWLAMGLVYVAGAIITMLYAFGVVTL